MTPEKIAEISWNAARVYDDTQPAWDRLDDYEQQFFITLVSRMRQNISLMPHVIHEHWSQHMQQNGWSFDGKESRRKKTTPYIIEWYQLPESKKRYWTILVNVMRALVM